MCLDNPAKGLAGLLSTHPTIEDRIAALERHAGGWRPHDAEIGSPRLARRPA
jgi:heat shock protein HtpX